MSRGGIGEWEAAIARAVFDTCRERIRARIMCEPATSRLVPLTWHLLGLSAAVAALGMAVDLLDVAIANGPIPDLHVVRPAEPPDPPAA